MGEKTKTVLDARGLEPEKKELPLYVKAKCVGTKQTAKTRTIDVGPGSKIEWNEELQFTLNPQKYRKMADRILEFKVMSKAHVMDDCLGTFEVALDGLSHSPHFFRTPCVPLDYLSPSLGRAAFLVPFFAHEACMGFSRVLCTFFLAMPQQRSRARWQRRGSRWSAKRRTAASCT